MKLNFLNISRVFKGIHINIRDSISKLLISDRKMRTLRNNLILCDILLLTYLRLKNFNLIIFKLYLNFIKITLFYI